MLTQRRREILRAVVDHYVASAVPVGSKVLVERYGFDFSPATIRADLAALEDEQLLRQPHTSAGRLPTDGGYRNVVDEYLAHPDLLGAGPLYPDVLLRSELGGVMDGSRQTDSLDELMRRTSMILSAYTNCLAIATAPTPTSAKVTRLCYKGLAELVTQPEFSAPERFFRLMRILDDNDGLSGLVLDSFEGGEVTVRIGHENCRSGLDELSIVLSPYRAGTNRRHGLVAVVGPTRMDYRRAIPAVTTAAFTLSELLGS